MAISYTAKGTTSGVLYSASTPMFSSVAVSAGSTLVVAINYNNAVAGPDSVQWNGYTLTFIDGNDTADHSLVIYYVENVLAGTGDVIVDLSTASQWSDFCATLIEIKGGAALNILDVYHSAMGTSTTPSSGATTTTAQAAEIALGFIGCGFTAFDPVGTWSNSYTTGQNVTTTGRVSTINDGYKVLAATGAQTAAKNGWPNTNWVAVVVTFKEAAAAATGNRASLFYNLIRPRKVSQ